MLREAKGTWFLFLLIAAWHIITGFALNGNGKFILGMPQWFVISTFGAGIIACVGIVILVKTVFIDFEYEEEIEEDAV